MRRADREIKAIEDILNIIDSCKVFRVAMAVDNEPYIVPLNFGYNYEKETFEFYFHCANEGKKLNIIRQNPKVCFEIDCDHELVEADSACAHSYKYRSIIGSGIAEIVTDIEQKKIYMTRLMKHQTGKDFKLTDEQVRSVTVSKIVVDKLSAKGRIF